MLTAATSSVHASYVLPAIVGVFTLALVSVLLYAVLKVRNIEVVSAKSRRIDKIGTWVLYVAIAAALTMLFTDVHSIATAITFAVMCVAFVFRGLLFVALRVLGPEQQQALG